MTSRHFEAVFFDMDGTLVNTEPYWLRAETSLMAEFDYQWTPEDQRHCLGGPLPRVGEYMRSITGRGDALFYVNELISRVEKLFHEGTDFMPGAEALMLDLAKGGIPLGLVSASPRVLVDATLKAIPTGIFAVSVSSDDVIKSKPDPEPYVKAAASLGVDIANCLVLEDSLTGISSAQASGAYTLAIPHIVQVTPHDRTHVIETLEGLDSQALNQLFALSNQNGVNR